MAHPIVSLAAFQVCWFACVGGAARGLPWLGPLAVAVYAAGHLRTVPSGRARTRQAGLLVLAGAAGYAADSVLVLSGVLTFPPQAVLGWPSTAWMVALWVLQAAVLSGILSWLRGRHAVAAIVGAIGGPLAYLAGERMGAAVLGPSRAAALAAIGVEWAFAMPLLVWMECRARLGPRAAGG
ncbi:MAG: DUF2878 domain-containing protein [Vicinamibacterales bacterium]